MIYGEPVRFEDPARFSFAHGGKDGHPFPVPLKVYDETLQYLSRSVRKSSVEADAKRSGLRNLYALQKQIEKLERIEADPEAVIAEERRNSFRYGGRTVAGPVQFSGQNCSRKAVKKNSGKRAAVKPVLTDGKQLPLCGSD